MHYKSTLLIGLIFAVLSASVVSAEDEHLGLIEYEIACLPCHGISGQGNGPQARQLSTKPSDLTMITKTFGGIFPFKRIAAIIDGRTLVTAHGQREMPVWGDRYRLFVEPGESRALVERRAQRRIRALTQYVEDLQVK